MFYQSSATPVIGITPGVKSQELEVILTPDSWLTPSFDFSMTPDPWLTPNKNEFYDSD